MKLQENDRIAVIGGGPAGAMTGFFLLELASRIGLTLQVDIYEPRDFSLHGPKGCNMCAGVVSESLVQTLAAEGINLPPMVVQRGIDSYVLHTSDLKPVSIDTPADDLRIATVFRGGGPRQPTGDQQWGGFDHYLLELASERGARVVPEKVSDLTFDKDRPQVVIRSGERVTYDFLVGAVGVNAPILKKFENLTGPEFKPPPVTRGFVSEIYLGSEVVQEYLGSSMHIFLLDIKGLKFAAIIPKVEYVTVCLMGDDIDKELVRQFMTSAEVRSCFPPDFEWKKGMSNVCEVGEQVCTCAPKLNVGPAVQPFADRVVMVGDSAVSRLYKDGIGAAYLTAKAVAVTSVFFGISKNDFEAQYKPVYGRVAFDNRIGTVIFLITLLYQKLRFMRRGMVRMVMDEESMTFQRRIMSRVLWDTFTGSATYREIFLRTLTPIFFLRLVGATIKSYWSTLRGKGHDREIAG
ncbi:MAG: hypothetical protein HQL52_06900 [Magnetococcales bacterium]|nr:hypothetical protein [Magnetococcales bacterium]